MERYRLELEDYDRRMETYLFALDMKDDYLLAYNESRRLLIEELDHIKEIGLFLLALLPSHLPQPCSLTATVTSQCLIKRTSNDDFRLTVCYFRVCCC